MEKVWYIKIDASVEGPFTVEELARDKRLSPDTLVWKKGFEAWKKAGEVEELSFLFEEEPPENEEEEDKGKLLRNLPLDDEIAIDGSEAPPPLHLWLLILLILLFSFFYNFYSRI